MIPVLYNKSETTFTHNGVGLLSEAVKATVTEERNGSYELSLQYPMRYENMIFGYKVNHPGARATNVLRDTVQNNLSEIRAAQEEYLKEITKKLEEAGLKIDKGNEFEDDD